MANPVKIVKRAIKVVAGFAAGVAGLVGIGELAEKAKDLIIEGSKDIVEGATES